MSYLSPPNTDSENDSVFTEPEDNLSKIYFQYYLYFIIRWIIYSEELSLISLPSPIFEEVTHSHNKEPELVESHKVKLRGIKINSTK